MATDPIDFVVTWVNGADPRHLEKRSAFLDPTLRIDAHEAARFEHADEIRYCIRSILNHAPWVRRIWLVTDDQFPASLKSDPSGKLSVVDHRALFAGDTDLLPTFNSQSIETRLHRIPGLAERYVYFNDDVLLCAPTLPEDFFPDGKVLLRHTSVGMPAHPETIYQSAQINAGRMLGIEPDRLFRVGHVTRSFLRSAVERLERLFPEEFTRNAAYRFRDPGQFIVSTLFENFALREGLARVTTTRDWLHIMVDECATLPLSRAKWKLMTMRHHRVKIACVNDLTSLSKRLPTAATYVSEAAGPPVPIEVPQGPLPSIERDVTPVDVARIAAHKLRRLGGRARRALTQRRAR